MIYRVMLVLGLLLVGSFAAGAQDAEIRTVYVGPVLVDCVGVAPQQCLQVKDSADGAYELFYSGIEGFDFQPGYVYELRVAVTPVENPPADAPNETWSLVEVVSMTRALEGTLWQLVTFPDADGETVNALTGATTLELDGSGRFGGNAGCNSYGGSYTLDGTALELGDAVSTLMACLDEALMMQETQFLGNLANVASYAIVDDQLQLLDSNGTALMTFDAVEHTPLAGTNWVMTWYNDGSGGLVSALEGVEVTALFDAAEGRLSGSAGCNSYSATYTAGSGSISIGPAISTRMACPQPEGVMAQEAAYLGALAGAAAYQIAGDVLELRGADGAVVARYQAQTSIVGTTWWWQSYSSADGVAEAVPNPENYALTFNADGTISLRADCNQGTAAYTLNGSEIRITPGVMTLVACPPESLSDAFLAHLAAVTTAEHMGASLLLSPGANGEVLYFVAASGG